MKKIFLISIFLFLITIITIYQISDSIPIYAQAMSRKPHPDIAADFALKDLNGDTIRLSDYAGKVILLNFWATWCGPCRMEIPHFIELQNKYEKDGFTVIGISIDEGDKRIVKQFYDRMKMNYPVLFADDKVREDYGGVYGVPTSFLIDRDGIIVRKYIGSRPKRVFENDILSLLQPDNKN